MKIVIKNKYLEVKEVKELLVSHNVNTYQMDVDFNESYLNRQLFIYFKNGNVKKFEVVGPDNKVNIPHEVLENIGKLYIGAFSPNEKDNTLLDRYCTNFDSIDVIEGAYDKDATPSEELTPTILEKYLQEMKNFYNESIEKYNNNANEKTEEFNKNYENKKSEIDKVAEVVSKDKSDVEKMKKSIETSAANAQKSEENAKKSEETAGEYLDEVKNISNAMTFANFEVDVETGELQINTPERFENAGFTVNENGDLEVEISG